MRPRKIAIPAGLHVQHTDLRTAPSPLSLLLGTRPTLLHSQNQPARHPPLHAERQRETETAGAVDFDLLDLREVAHVRRVEGDAQPRVVIHGFRVDRGCVHKPARDLAQGASGGRAPPLKDELREVARDLRARSRTNVEVKCRNLKRHTEMYATAQGAWPKNVKLWSKSASLFSYRLVSIRNNNSVGVFLFGVRFIHMTRRV